MRRIVILNDYFPREVQEDIKLANPVMDHTKYIQKAIDDNVKPGDYVEMYGTFNVDKNVGYMPEFYGEDGRVLTGAASHITLNGSQPCISIESHNNQWNFSNCRFYVLRSFNDGLGIRCYSGKNKLDFGEWILKRIHDIDPDGKAAEDRLFLQRNPAKRWLPPIDGKTGFASKGYANAGFNTTSYSTHELSNYRSNNCDTSKISTGGGGYGGNYPQDDGTTARTWGSWDKGFIGNFNAGVLINQNPKVPKAKRDAATFTVLGGYVRGWTYCGVQIGSIGGPKGEVVPNTLPDVDGYICKNVTIQNVVVEDVYESGIQRSRFDNLTIDRCIVRRSGHPEWDLYNDAKPERPGVSQVDPGYGTASGRKNMQGKLTITNSTFIDCNRKGIDAHHGTTTVIANNFVKAGYWGIQVALEEPQVDRAEPGWEHEVCTYVVKDNIIHAGIKAIDFTNGAFGSNARVAKNLWYMKVSVKVLNNTTYGPYGWVYNYAHDGFVIDGNTFIFSLPYGQFKVGGNEEGKSFGIFHGTQDPTGRGVGIGDVITNNRVMNSRYGNFTYGMTIQPCTLLTLKGNRIDTTPFRSRKIENSEEPFISTLPYVFRDGVPTTPWLMTGNMVNLIEEDNWAYNRMKLDILVEGMRKLEPGTEDNAVAKAANAALNKPIFNISGVVKRPEDSNPNNFVVNVDNVTTEGNNPPAGFDFIVSQSSPKMVLTTRNGDRPNTGKFGDATTGVYAKVYIPARNDTVIDTIEFTLNIKNLSMNGVGTVLSVQNGDLTLCSLLNNTSTGGKLMLVHGQKAVYVNGTKVEPRVNYEVQFNTKYKIQIVTTNLKNSSYMLLGTPSNGNNQITADFSDITVYRTRDLTTE